MTQKEAGEDIGSWQHCVSRAAVRAGYGNTQQLQGMRGKHMATLTAGVRDPSWQSVRQLNLTSTGTSLQ
jgi:hypothetical protein